MYARSSTISDVYNILLDKYNCRVESWWPVTTSKKQDREFEIIIGVILTQNTNWNNVVKSIKNLKKHDLISIEKIKNIDIKRLEELIRPSGFFRQKAVYLKNICSFFLKNKTEDIRQMDLQELRKRLLNVVGIGKESADSILLYALNRPIFVIDAYTKRIAQRINLLDYADASKYTYDTLQKTFGENLEKDVVLFKQYHGLIVEHAKEYCRKKPICNGCVLKKLCSY
ncbi:MAG: endonuclease [Candidatus Aenigmarchaeota archaeon]|nr:endonuclease [Candidatus Aenigmarchaeota archaeon]